MKIHQFGYSIHELINQLINQSSKITYVITLKWKWHTRLAAMTGEAVVKAQTARKPQATPLSSFNLL